jgi:cytochrome b subunit of formate dehydrogenase
MSKVKYVLLLISFFVFCIVGGILHIEYIKADEYAKFEGSLQAAKKALNLEIINTIYFPIILMIHLTLFIIFKFKGSGKSLKNNTKMK